MTLFRTDSLVLCYSDVETAKQWWIDTFDCRQAKVPADWDSPLPSDIALKLPEDAQPTILLCSRAEVQNAGFERQNGHAVIYSGKLKKAREYLIGKCKTAGPIQGGGGTEFFEIRDSESNVIEICKEP